MNTATASIPAGTAPRPLTDTPCPAPAGQPRTGLPPRHIVLTGATRGVGPALVAEFVRLGHRVSGCGSSDLMVEELRQRYPGAHQFDVLDVSRDDQVQAWSRRVLDRHGPPDLLINNSPLLNRTVPLWEISGDEFSRVIDINIKGVACIIRHFVPAMIARNTGVIVNFSCTWRRSLSPEFAPYCSTQWGVEGLTKALAGQLPPGMAAVPLNPGVVLSHVRHPEEATSPGENDPEAWASRVVPFLLQVGASHNGQTIMAA